MRTFTIFASCLVVFTFAACAAGENLIEDGSFELTKPADEVSGPATRIIASFEDGTDGFSTGESVARHATEGKSSLRIKGGFAALEERMDWTGFDYLEADIYNESTKPADLYIEIRDDKTTGYWTRVNYNTIVPPGQSTVVMPTNIYVGEKSRPGRRLDKAAVTRLVFSIPEGAAAPVYIDNVRLVCDDSARRVRFDGLYAFDFGTEASPLMEGFTKFTPATVYSTGRGYGLEDAQIWKAYDALQPEPLYQDFLCILSGGVAIDLPDGNYHVFLNIDSPSGFWGEYQVYRERTVRAEGRVVVQDTMDFASFNQKYYRFWDTEDLPSDDTFEKYQEPYFQEKEFDVEVTDGQLNIDFQGSGWAVSLSALVVYPVEKSAEGARFLEFARARRRFHFDNYFKRILHTGSNADFAPSAQAQAAGLVIFRRGYMADVYYNDRPAPGEVVDALAGAAFAGEYEPVTFSLLPLEDLGEVTVKVSELAGDAGVIDAGQIDVGFVSYRLSRVTMEGSVYTISPRLVMPSAKVDAPAGVTRRFWLTVRPGEDAAPGVYTGEVEVASAGGTLARLPIEFTVHPGTLDGADVPAGSWGHTIDTPWFSNDPAGRRWNEEMAQKSLAKLREGGFTAFSGMPSVSYRGFQDGKPVFDFTTADAQMKAAREAGFTMPITNYVRFAGLNLYYKDTAAMEAAGFSDYAEFIRAVWTPLQAHAEEAGWLPVYWNLADEPIGDDLLRSIENARAYREAFPEGPPFFTGATSFRSADAEDPHFELAKALHVANVNGHDEPAVNLLHQAGGDWAFYNGGNRWTYGIYMYKAVKEFDMKLRVSWHWNVVAGDPYYALDCREDDYAWCNSSPSGVLLPSLTFIRNREGLDDYRMLVTMARLARENADAPAAQAADELIEERMSSFQLGQRDHDALFGVDDWDVFRGRVTEVIGRLRGS